MTQADLFADAGQLVAHFFGRAVQAQLLSDVAQLFTQAAALLFKQLIRGYRRAGAQQSASEKTAFFASFSHGQILPNFDLG